MKMKQTMAVLTMTAIMAQSTVAFGAGNSVVFDDLQGYDWARPAIENMAAQGVLYGIGNSKYAPAASVTVLEFASMAMRAYGGKDAAIELAKQQGNLESIEASNGEFWGNSTICASQKFGLTDRFGTGKERWQKPATRSEMAYIVMTISEQMGGEQFLIKDAIKNNIGDYEEVLKHKDDVNYILKAYSNGILCGTNDAGDYKPAATAKRAEAAAIMNRLLDPSKRINVEVKPEAVKPEVKPEVNNNQAGVYTALPDGSNVLPDGMTLPAEGQIGPNGKPISRDKETGVLGFGNGQHGGIYTGVKYGNGAQIEVGDDAPLYAAGYDENAKGKYVEFKGYTYWRDEWLRIENVTGHKLMDKYPNAKEGSYADIHGNLCSEKEACFKVYEGTWTSIIPTA